MYEDYYRTVTQGDVSTCNDTHKAVYNCDAYGEPVCDEPTDCQWEYVDDGPCCNGVVELIQSVTVSETNGGNCPVVDPSTRNCTEEEVDVCACVYSEWTYQTCMPDIGAECVFGNVTG